MLLPVHTVRPRSSNLFYIVSYFLKWVTTSWTYGSMVLILDGNLEIGAPHVRSNICYLICLRHLIGSRAVTNRICSLRKDLFSFVRAHHVLSYPSNISTKVLTKHATFTNTLLFLYFIYNNLCFLNCKIL